MKQEPKAQITHYVHQIRKKAKSAHFPRYLRKNYVKLVTDVHSITVSERIFLLAGLLSYFLHYHPILTALNLAIDHILHIIPKPERTIFIRNDVFLSYSSS